MFKVQPVRRVLNILLVTSMTLFSYVPAHAEFDKDQSDRLEQRIREARDRIKNHHYTGTVNGNHCAQAQVPATEEEKQVKGSLKKAIFALGGAIVGSYLIIHSGLVPACNSPPPGNLLPCLQLIAAGTFVLKLGEQFFTAIAQSDDNVTCNGDSCFKTEWVCSTTTTSVTSTTLHGGGGGSTGLPDFEFPTTTLYDPGNGPSGPGGPDLNPPNVGSTTGSNPTGPIPDYIDQIKDKTGIDVTQAVRETEGILNNLDKQGYKQNSDGSITTPRGKINPSSLQSANGMKAAGFSDAEISAGMKSQADIKSKGDKMMEDVLKKLGIDENDNSGASFSNSGKSASGGIGFDPSRYLKNIGTPSTKTATSNKLSGLSKSDGKGGQIGVAADDLFGMIHRRYEENTKKCQFLNNATGANTCK